MRHVKLIFGLFLLMTSCEYGYDYSYKVINKVDSQIDVHVKTYKIDSTYSILKDSSKILFVTGHGIEGSHGPYFKDVKFDLQEFTVIKNDSLKSNKDYLQNEAWIFSKEPSYEGLYTTTVTTEEFNK
jgi:hypothetical protein